MPRTNDVNQAPTAVKSWALTGLVSAGVSVDLAGGSDADTDGGSGTSLECEDLWLTLTFFFLSKAIQRKVSEITWRGMDKVNNTC